MSKRIGLEPRKTTLGASPWLVNIPAKISETGKRERHFFKTKEDAQTFCRQQRTRLDNFGSNATMLSPGQLEEAASAFERLEPLGVSLNTAVSHYLKWRKQTAASVPFKELFEMFIAAKAGRSQAYLSALRYTLPRFASLHDRLASELTPRDLEAALRGMTPSVRNAFLRNLRAVLNYGLKRGYLSENTALKLDFEELPQKEVVTLTPDEAKRLLTAAEADFTLLPYHAIALFAGVRPLELERLQWRDIDLHEKHIHIRPEVAKTGRRRIIDMEPILCDWLGAFIARGGKNTGPITPTKNLRSNLRAIREAAKIHKWHQDVMRHSYASYWLAQHGDINRLTLYMGHESTAMLWKHYHKAVKRKDAERYWSIKPKFQSGKIVSIEVA